MGVNLERDNKEQNWVYIQPEVEVRMIVGPNPEILKRAISREKIAKEKDSSYVELIGYSVIGRETKALRKRGKNGHFLT